MSATILKFTTNKPFGDLSKPTLEALDGVEEVFDVGENIGSYESHIWIVRLCHDRSYNIRSTKQLGEYELDYIDTVLEISRTLPEVYSAAEVMTMIKCSAMSIPTRLGSKKRPPGVPPRLHTV